MLKFHFLKRGIDKESFCEVTLVALEEKLCVGVKKFIIYIEIFLVFWNIF